MARPVVFHPSVRRPSVAQRRIRALPPAAVARPGDIPARPRYTLEQRCQALDVTLKQEWRTLGRIFDESDAPLSVGEVWNRARALGLKASRSHVNHVIQHLLTLGVLIAMGSARSIQYAMPLTTRMTLLTQNGKASLAIEDPHALEALAAALLSAGQRLDGRRIEIRLVDPTPTTTGEPGLDDLSGLRSSPDEDPVIDD